MYAHSTITGQWLAPWVVPFTATSTPIHTFETPVPYGLVQQPFAVSGWAIDGAAPTGTGIDAIDIWQYANVGSGAAPTQLTGVTTGVSRPDVAAVYGSRFQPSGVHEDDQRGVAGHLLV